MVKAVIRAARLSPAAVSRYLNGSLSLPPTTRMRIERVVRELGYSPNPHARSLSRGRSDAIGLVIPELTIPSSPAWRRRSNELPRPMALPLCCARPPQGRPRGQLCREAQGELC